MPDRPNIIYIMADDMGYGDPGCYGAEKIPTPNMDRVAADGVIFTDAHSSSAVCTPSRYSVLTGRYCWRTRLKQGVEGGLSRPLIDPARLTVAGLLKQAGYATAAVGKWHVGLDWQDKEGVRRDTNVWEDEGLVDYTKPVLGGPTVLGFDYFFGIAGSLDMPPYCHIENDRTVGIPNVPKKEYFAQQKKGFQVEGWDDTRVDVLHCEKAVAWLKDHAARKPDQPFFLYLTPSAPHRPCVPPGFLAGRSQAGARGDMVCVVDWMVGEIDKALAEIGRAEDTLVMITGDNGAQPYDVDRQLHGHKSCGELRGYKSHVWEGGHREPFIVRWPKRIAAGGRREQTICLMDLMATCAEMTGQDLPDHAAEDSFSFLPALLDEGGRTTRPDLIHHSVRGLFSIRRDNWKLVLGRGGGGLVHENLPRLTQDDDLPGQLYDMAADFREEHNLYARHPDVVEELAGLAQGHVNAGRTRPKR